MKLKDLLTLISNVAKKENLSTPFIVGGIPRDKLANRLNSISDIDFTTGNADVHYLAKEIAFELKELKPNETASVATEAAANAEETAFKLAKPYDEASANGAARSAAAEAC